MQTTPKEPSSIPFENDPNFYKQLAQQNFKRMYALAKFFLWVSLALVLATVWCHFFFKSYPHYHSVYIIPYGLMFLSNFMVLLLANPKKFNQNGSLDYYKQLEEITAYYICWLLILSLSISLIDFHYQHHTVAYIMSLVICASFFIMRLRYFIAPLIVAVIAYILNYFTLDEPYIRYTFEMHLAIFLTPVLLVVAHFNYQNFITSFQQEKYLCRETTRSRQLANELAAANTELQRLSATDELTKIANRRGFHQYKATLEERVHPYTLTVLMLDIDYFKVYNDYYGHAYGDMVLARVATVLNHIALSTNSFAARMGGEEFIMLIPDQRPEEIVIIYKRVLRDIQQFNLSNAASKVSDQLTFSAGAYRGKIKTNDEIEEFMHKADTLLYDIKKAGRNGFKLMEDEEVLYHLQPIIKHKRP